MAKTLPRQFFATKLTLLGLTIIHLLTTLTYGILIQIFLSQSKLKYAYTEDLIKYTRPKLIVAGSFNVLADIACLISLFTWEVIASLLSCLLIMVAIAGNHFGAMNDPPPLNKIHWIFFTLGGIMFILSVYYMMMQCQVGVLKPKWAHENKSNEVLVTQLCIVESKGLSCMKQILVSFIMLHFIWTIAYIVQHIMYLLELEKSTGDVTYEEIDIKYLFNNWVLFQACLAEAFLVGVIVLFGNVVALFGILQHKNALVFTFMCTILFSAFYALEGSNIFYLVNLACCLPLLVFTIFFFIMQLISTLDTATAIQQKIATLNSNQQNSNTTTKVLRQPENITSNSSSEES